MDRVEQCITSPLAEFLWYPEELDVTSFYDRKQEKNFVFKDREIFREVLKEAIKEKKGLEMLGRS